MYLPTPNVRQTKHTNNIHYHNNITQLAEEIITNIHIRVQSTRNREKSGKCLQGTCVCVSVNNTHAQSSRYSYILSMKRI